MASLFEGVREVQAQQNQEIANANKNTLTRSGSIDNLLGNQVMRANERGALLGNAITGAAQVARPDLFGENPMVKVRKITQIRQQLANDFKGKPRDQKYFNALADTLEDQGYVNEGDEARSYGQKFRKTESEIRTSEKGEDVVEETAANISSETARNNKITGWYDKVTTAEISNLDAKTKDTLAGIGVRAEELNMSKAMLDGKIKNLYAQAGYTDAQAAAVPHSTFAKYADIALREEALEEQKRNGVTNRDTALRSVAIAEELQVLKQQTQDFAETAKTEELVNEGVRLGINLADLNVRQQTALANIGLTEAETKAVPQRIKNEQNKIIVSELQLSELSSCLLYTSPSPRD